MTTRGARFLWPLPLVLSVKRIRNHGTWVWQARVAYKGRRRAAFRATKDEARTAEGDLLRALKAEHGEAEQAAAAPATLRQLLTLCVDDMRARGPTRTRQDDPAARPDQLHALAARLAA